MMAIDTTTDEVMAVAKDERSVRLTERFSIQISTEEALRFWAEMVKRFLNLAHGKEQQRYSSICLISY